MKHRLALLLTLSVVSCGNYWMPHSIYLLVEFVLCLILLAVWTSEFSFRESSGGRGGNAEDVG